jgi:hypothetical protein
LVVGLLVARLWLFAPHYTTTPIAEVVNRTGNLGGQVM